MAQYQVNINELLFATFGVYSLLKYDIPDADAGRAVKPFGAIEIVTDDVIDGYSIIGTPMFMPVSILDGNYPVYNPANPASPILTDYAGYDFPSNTICIFNRAKNIVKTAVEGRDSTVKELISMSDWNVSITGILSSPSGSEKYPADKVEALRALFEVPAALAVTGKIFQLLGIHNIVLESLSIPQVDGVKNIQPFQIMCSSDEPIELQLKQ